MPDPVATPGSAARRFRHAVLVGVGEIVDGEANLMLIAVAARPIGDRPHLLDGRQ